MKKRNFTNDYVVALHPRVEAWLAEHGVAIEANLNDVMVPEELYTSEELCAAMFTGENKGDGAYCPFCGYTEGVSTGHKDVHSSSLEEFKNKSDVFERRIMCACDRCYGEWHVFLRVDRVVAVAGPRIVVRGDPNRNEGECE